ncbi:hypothetical protein DEU56DRAFT_934085 [Suillus clintonianus]|uniref:uncharacterized protein n=1 Tax=Suillus clintonianus TaxID=1904413 RepID=UPI001B87269E|nr:uncharacterized protein DEU56DRAFT_934085 [Suillus clintonianus]KAG2113376.1 hypothetical protein DEU56DRAFT_934085 [Suillus clintonianus]
MPQSKSERPQKHAKPEQTSRKAYKFLNAIDVRRARPGSPESRPESPNGSPAALSALRSTLSVKSEEIIAPQDERIALEWMESSPGAHDTFEIWEGTNQMRKITSFAFGSNELQVILVSLKLFNTISHFGGGRERKALCEAFPWDMKTFVNLSHEEERERRRRGRLQDLRYYILLSIFKALSQDSYLVVRKVLEMCWVGLWSDPKVKRTVRIGLFTAVTIEHLLKLYERAGAENADGDHIVSKEENYQQIVNFFKVVILLGVGNEG